MGKMRILQVAIRNFRCPFLRMSIKLTLFLLVLFFISIHRFILSKANVMRNVRFIYYNGDFNDIFIQAKFHNGTRNHSATDSHQSPRNTTHIYTKCALLISGDSNEKEQAKLFMKKNTKNIISPNAYIKMTENCTKFKIDRQYWFGPVSKMETEFPIAFGITMYRDVELMERLLRAIYRPHNYYCVHVDRKTSRRIKQAVHAIANCFTNVQVSPADYLVRWGTVTVLLSQIACMRDLWKYSGWKYFLTLTGQEFPLKTNYEIVQILKAYNQSNDIHAESFKYLPRLKLLRYRKWTEYVWQGFNRRTMKKKSEVPHNISLAKGEAHIVATRGFVDFILHSKIAADFLKWISDTRNPDELYFQSINSSPHLSIPGSYEGIYSKHYMGRFKKWVYGRSNRVKCSGIIARGICIFGIGELPELTSSPKLFANKFHINIEPLALDCLEEHLHSRSTRYISIVNSTYYVNLPFVKLAYRKRLI